MSPSANALVHFHKEGPVAVLTLSAPPANCYSYDMMRELDAAILKARFDADVHAIVLTGEGDKFFCAGADISMLNDVTPEFKYQFCLHANETLLRLEQTNKLVVAAINGHCVGGGLEVALACDLRIARLGSAKVGVPEVKLGVLPGTGGTARLTRLLGKAKALELMVEGGNLTMEQGVALGLLHRGIEADNAAQFLADVISYTQSLCPPQSASMAVGHIKRSVQSGGEMGLEQHLAFERELQQRLFTSQDAREGILAYVEKRKPEFSGR